jgi:hypothetical protein
MINENGWNDRNWKEDEIDEEFHCDVLLNELEECENEVSNRFKNNG